MTENQMDLFEEHSPPSFPCLEQALSQLPALPKVVRYYSDFYQRSFSIDKMEMQDEWPFAVPEADANLLKFTGLTDRSKRLLKSWTIWALSHISPVTIYNYLYEFKKLGTNFESIAEVLLENPINAKTFWEMTLLGKRFPHDTYCALKSILNFLCDLSLGGWGPEYTHYAASFPLPFRRGKYMSVREGSSYLSIAEQAAIVEYFDNLTRKVKSTPEGISNKVIRDACLLYWAFSHGVRPVQLANRELRDIRLWQTEDDGTAVHLTFRYAKQRSRGRDAVQTRTMKREWSAMMVEYLSRRLASPSLFVTDPLLSDSLFGLRPKPLAKALKDILRHILDKDRKAYDLRHTAAQRNVDAGMTALELAEFMMHADIDTGQVYYQTSSNQVEKINSALGLSPVYGELAVAIKTGIIDKPKLLGLPPDNQVGAAPHGFPIAGIGACSLGQSLCAKSPALSCYSCPKFMALADKEIHIQVRSTLQTIVYQFADAEASELGQPAYTQLRAALEGVSQVISDLSFQGDDQ